MPVPTVIGSRLVLFLACFLVASAIVPRTVSGRDADAYFDADSSVQDPLARGVARAILGHEGRDFYHTGNLRFDGQSAVAIYQMAILGLGQIVLDHPDKAATYLPAIQSAAERLVDPATLLYAAEVYGHHGVTRMDPGEGHAYLGYINLALGMLRAVDPETHLCDLHDRLTAQLAQRLAQSPHGLIETYPGETWPPDVAAVAGSIGLHAKVTGHDRSAMLEAWAERFASCAIDRSGYLIQRVKTGTCVPFDAPRGSGTAVASYFIGFANADLSRRLHDALVFEGQRGFLGFGAISEYARGTSGSADVNAGPVILGVSVGATGFSLGAARMNHDRDLFRSLYRTTHLLGLPVTVGDARYFAAGGVLGNALLLAMLTARSP